MMEILDGMNSNGLLMMATQIAYFNVLIYFRYHRPLKRLKKQVDEIMNIKRKKYDSQTLG